MFSKLVVAVAAAAAIMASVTAQSECPVNRGMICQMDIDSVIDIETSEEVDIYSCRTLCFREPNCQNYTFFHHEDRLGIGVHKCVLFRQCDGLSFCATCTTGPSDCDTDTEEKPEFSSQPPPDTTTTSRPTLTPTEAVPSSPEVTTSRRPFDLGSRGGPQGPAVQLDSRQPKQLEQQFTGDDDDYNEEDVEEDDYVDPFNVDDGLLQDDNEIEDFPDEDEDEDREEVTTPTPDDNDFNPQDDAETIDDDDEDEEEPKYFHCLFGGYGPFGVVNSIGHLGRFPFQLFSPIPSFFPLGYGGTYTSMVNGSLYMCSPGAVKQTTRFVPSFFGPVQTRTTEELQSGSCVTYNAGAGEWQKAGGKMNSYRAGGSMTKLGNFMVAAGGRSQFGPTSSLRTIEVMSTRRPGKWRVLSKFQLPGGTHDHCTVAVNRTAMFMAGGVGQESQAYIIDLKAKTRQPLQAMKQPRSQHSCIRVRINGRDGIIAGGGQSDAVAALNSLEFYDLARGQWYSLGRMRQGRRFPSLSLMSGKLVASGGETTDNRGQTVVMDDMEMLQGRRWRSLQQKMPEARSRFSLQRIPTRYFFAKK